ncbi:MAG: lysophospholipase [Xanthobacteraceae bacterium]|nr:lysophospholipase [Xanthobacteraceae bacterium]
MGCALIVHGLGEHGGRYAHVAAALNDLGIEVWAHDHRGFGKSQGKRGVIASRTSLLEDTKLVFDKIRADADASGSQSKAILIGHSMGGAIVARAVTGGWITPRALVLSSPGLKSFINPIMRGTVKVMEYATPDLAVPHGLPLDKISHDAAVLAEAKNDPLNHRLISPRLTNFILEAGEAAVRDAEKLPVPALVQAAGDDKLVDVNGARAFAAAAPSGLCTLKIYEGLWHEIYNEREPDRAAVLADLKNWLSRVVLR